MMQISVDGKIIDIKLGQKFISGGKTFGICAGCLRVIRADGWLRGFHICNRQ